MWLEEDVYIVSLKKLQAIRKIQGFNPRCQDNFHSCQPMECSASSWTHKKTRGWSNRTSCIQTAAIMCQSTWVYDAGFAFSLTATCRQPRCIKSWQILLCYVRYLSCKPGARQLAIYRWCRRRPIGSRDPSYPPTDSQH